MVLTRATIRALAGAGLVPSNTNNIPIADELCPDSVSLDCGDRRRLAGRQARARKPSARACACGDREFRTPACGGAGIRIVDSDRATRTGRIGCVARAVVGRILEGVLSRLADRVSAAIVSR